MFLGRGNGGLQKPQQWKKEESERLRGEKDRFHKLHVIGMNDWWDGVGGLDNEIWKKCE